MSNQLSGKHLIKTQYYYKLGEERLVPGIEDLEQKCLPVEIFIEYQFYLPLVFVFCFSQIYSVYLNTTWDQNRI